MDVIGCLAVLHEVNITMVKRLLRPVDTADAAGAARAADDTADAAVQTEMLEIILTWPKEPGEILTPLSTPTEYNYRERMRRRGESE